MGRAGRPKATTVSPQLRGETSVHTPLPGGNMSDVYKVSLPGGTYVFKTLPREPSERLQHILREEGITAEHAARAEEFSYQTAAMMGCEHLLPYIQRRSIPGLGEGTLQEFVEGSSVVDRNREHIQAWREGEREAERESYQQLLSGFYYDPSSQISQEEWLRRARALALLDTVIGNTDRNVANILFTREGPIGIDHGLAFTAGDWKSNPQTMIARLDVAVHASGGSKLREDEISTLQSLRNSNWLEEVEENFGQEQANMARERLDYMLRSGRFHPLIIGTRVAGGDKPII